MKKDVIKSTMLIMFFTLIAKILGFVKSMIQASYFGASMVTDAFNIAQGFSSNILTLLATAISVAFVPIYLRCKVDENRNEREFASKALMFFSLFSLSLSFIMFLWATPLMKLAAPSYEGYQLNLTVKFFRVLLISFTFAVSTSIYQQLLNAEKVYGFSAVSSLVNSIIVILCIVFFEAQIGIWSLVVAFIISYIIQNVFVFARGKQYGVYTFKYGIWNDSIKTLLVQSAPIFISQGTVEINQVIDKALLAKSGEGMVTVVSYAGILYGFVAQLLRTSFSTVLFTEFSELNASNKQKEIKKMLIEIVDLILIISVPLLFFVDFEATEIVQAVYGRGNYDMTAVKMTSIALSVYIFCLSADLIKNVVSKAYYSYNDTRHPMILGVFEVITNVLISIVLSIKFGMMGVVLGTVIAENIWLIVMLIMFNKKYLKFLNLSMIVCCIKIVISTVVSICIIFLSGRYIAVNPMVNFLIKSMLYYLIYGVVLWCLKERNFIDWINIICLYLKEKKKKM